MSLYRTHILVPIDEGTVQAGAFSVKRALLAELQRRGLLGEVKVLETGTVGVVGRGVLLVVYPERICYTHVREGDIATLVEEHLMKGRIAQGLAHLPADFGRGAAGLHDVGLTRKQNRIVLDRSW
ncbi:MAG TPA: (2Fe-2S) ferredoxin domain-containing protein, partial [Candidatus Aminicenantes bacterium]|nr:(2Fe-2S) ferredoxin domain-containing protein [Candidatus Aminicenantes bacterium]